MKPYSVFISRKSSDAMMSKEIFNFLKQNNIDAFDSDISLHEIGKTEYQSTIDTIIDKVEHFIVVGSSAENILSAWVKTEWEAFENEKRSGRKTGNLIVIVSKKVKIEELPLALRQKQVFKFEEKKFEKLLPYLSTASKNEIANEANTILIKNKIPKKYYLISTTALLFAIFIFFYFLNKPNEHSKIETFNADSLFTTTKLQFLDEGLDKNIAFENFKKAINSDIKYAAKAKEVFDQKALETPFLKEKYLELSEKILIYADSVNKAK